MRIGFDFFNAFALILFYFDIICHNDLFCALCFVEFYFFKFKELYMATFFFNFQCFTWKFFVSTCAKYAKCSAKNIWIVSAILQKNFFIKIDDYMKFVD